MGKIDKIESRFSIKFSHRVFFTENVFSQKNKVLKNILNSFDAQSKALFIIDESVAAHYKNLFSDIENYFRTNQLKTALIDEPILLPGGEQVKNNLDILLRLLSAIEKNHLDRHSYLIAIGGGATLDIAGFAAAIAHRGIRHIRIPTTTLSQCDSGVGIKNGLNLFGKKNFVGTFYPPLAVINDFNFLDSLPERDKRCGFAEAVKVALIKANAFFQKIQSVADRLVSFHKPTVKSVIKESARLHIEHIINGGDPFEMGNSKPLDFGHWSAHKLEELSNYELKHGEAVAIGIALDSIYCYNAGLIKDFDAIKTIIQLLQKLGFKIYTPELEQKDSSGNLALLQGIEEFREHLGGKLSITLITEIGKSIEVDRMNPLLIEKSIRQLKEFQTLYNQNDF
ncbi:MAG: 3-dehydroquinate synthase [Verrucomicrobiia bacterium]